MGICAGRGRGHPQEVLAPDNMSIFIRTAGCPDDVQLPDASWSSTLPQIKASVEQLPGVPPGDLMYAGKLLQSDNPAATGEMFAAAGSSAKFDYPISFVAFREVQLKPMAGAPSEGVWIDELYVWKGVRRAGVGSWLMHAASAGRPVELQVGAAGRSARAAYQALGMTALTRKQRGRVYDMAQRGHVLMSTARLVPKTGEAWLPRLELDELYKVRGWTKVESDFGQYLTAATMDAHGYTVEQATENFKGCGDGTAVNFLIIVHGAITLNLQPG